MTRGFRTYVLFTLMAATALAARAQFGGAPSVNITTHLDRDKVHAGDTFRAAVVVELTAGWHVNAHEPLEDYLIPTQLTFAELKGVEIRAVAYPEPILAEFSFSPQPMAVYEKQFVLGVRAQASEALTPGAYTLSGALRYQACNDKQCRAPATADVAIPFEIVPDSEPAVPQNEALFDRIAFPADTAAPGDASVEPPDEPKPRPPAADEDWESVAAGFETLGAGTGYMDAEEFLEFIERAEAGQLAAAEDQGAFAGKSIWLVVVLTILGGLALNLTPCVLPLIPINIAIIGAGAQAGSRKRGFALGGTYGAAIALVYGILGLIVVLTTGAFGAINASPWFNAAITVVFIILALAMFDVLQIDFTRLQGKLGLQKKQRGAFILAFVMGAVAALLAGACVAPVVIAVILFSRNLYAAGAPLGLVLPFLLGAGMALPWPFAGAGLSFLPKPGKWMVRVKYVFGAVILLIAVYYGRLAYQQFNERYFVDRASVRESVEESEGWMTSLSEGLARARAENQPVLIDFWATWCKSCLVMNETTFKDPQVVARLEPYVKIKYQAEVPSESPTKEIMDRFNVVGLPTYVVLKPHPNPLPPRD